MKKIVSIFIIVSFLLTGQAGLCPVYAQEFRLPAPGVRVNLSPEFNPPTLKGIKVHPENPFRFDFILDRGDALQGAVPEEQLKSEATNLIKYFLASLTIPEKDLWVNLSPYEKDRIIPPSFGLTEMGRDLLAEDYMLKQITASLIYPEDEIGKKFWKRVYEEAKRKFGTSNIPVNTFNKVWIVPEKAVVYENARAGTAYVVESKLKVMLEQDYLSLEKHKDSSATPQNDVSTLGSQVIREIVIPELTREVNANKNFAQLRQVYNSLILATWYKKKIRDSILEQVYADKKKTAGVGYGSKTNDIEAIYQRYLQAFKRGVYNYIKEEQDPGTQEITPRKYFSGGTNLDLDGQLEQSRFWPGDVSLNNAMVVRVQANPDQTSSDLELKPGVLDGRTIVRFSHSMELSSGGLQVYLSNLDRLLLERNHMTIIELFYTTDKSRSLPEPPQKIEKGTLIKIPIFYDPGTENSEGVFKDLIVNFVTKYRLNDKIRRILTLRHLQKILKLVPIVRKYYLSGVDPTLLREKLDEVIKLYKPDLIINHDPDNLPETLAISKVGEARNIPVVVQYHLANRLLSYKKDLSDVLVKYAHHLATVSSLDVPVELRGQSTPLWDGIDCDVFDLKNVKVSEVDKLRNKFNIRPQDRVVLMPARISPSKNQLDMLRAFLLSRKHNVRYKLILAGEAESRRSGSEINSFIKKYSLNSDVILTGHLSQDEMLAVYQMSRLVALPSLSEGLGRVLLEAEAMQRAVIAYNNSGMREALIHGKTGYLVNNYKELAQQIEHLLQDDELRMKMQEAGREFVVSEFSLTALAQRHEQFYRAIIHDFIHDRAMVTRNSAQLAAKSRSENHRVMKTAKVRDTGGIDFTANKTPLDVRNSGEGIKFHLDPAQLARLQNTTGFVPVIINMQPLIDLKSFLGV